MLYPMSEELKLRKVLNFFSLRRLNKIKFKKQNINSLQGQLFTFSDDDKKEFINHLAKLAIDINNQIFDSWSAMSDSELARTDLTGAKKWIKENVELFEKDGKATFDSLQRIRKANEERLRVETNKMFKMKLKGNLTKTKRQRILDAIDAEPRPSKEMRELKKKLEHFDEVSSSEISQLEEWTRKRNKNWANNQTGNFYSQSCKDLASTNNVKKYIWRTMEDSRVRPSHAKRNGKIFIFGEGIAPAEEWNCRCYAIPLIEKE